MVLLAVFYATGAEKMIGLSGLVYMLMGPVHGFHGAHYGKARAKLVANA
jgi:hypothetical protein